MPPPRLHILVVDDVDDFRTYAAAVLSRAGARVTAVASAADALAALARDVPDVILSDLTMPEMDGCALARAVRALPDPQAAKVTMVAISASRSFGLLEQTRTAGFDAYVPKPVAPRELVAAIERLAGALQIAVS